MTEELSLRSIPVFGIGSAIADLSLLCDVPSRLVSLPLSVVGQTPLNQHLKDLPVRLLDRAPGIGDLVVFDLIEDGSFPELEVFAGQRIPLIVGRSYIGVCGESNSMSHFTSDLSLLSKGHREWDLISVAGMVGHVTSHSRDLEIELGCGRPAKLRARGTLCHDNTDQPINTLREKGHFGIDSNPPLRADVPSVIAIFGTTTNVGKTTTAQQLIAHLRRRTLCGAIKATGTGSFGDTKHHLQAGALAASNFIRHGLPSTYSLPDALLVNLFHSMIDEVEASLAGMANGKLGSRLVRRSAVVLTEFGGDLIGAGNLAFLSDRSCLSRTLATVICSDNAVAAIGAIEILRRHQPDGRQPPVFLAMPLVNPEAFYRRMKPYIDKGMVAGIFDINRPETMRTEEDVRAYAISGAAIFSVEKLADELVVLAQEFSEINHSRDWAMSAR